MRKILTIICIIAIGAILVYVFWPEPKPPAPRNQEAEQLRKDYNDLQKDIVEGMWVQDSLKTVIADKDSIERVLKLDIARNRSETDKHKARAVELAKEVLKLKSDTTKDHLCDELANEALRFAELYDYQKALTDSLIVNFDSTKAALSYLYNKSDKSYNDLLKSYFKLFHAWQELSADQTALQKSLRRQKLKTKIAALLGLTLTGAALFK
jgi:septal ring factor EnvC (AmiA/AmiB activator)